MADDDEEEGPYKITSQMAEEVAADDAHAWPEGTPEAVEVLSTTLWKYLRSHDLDVAGPALALTFTRMLFVAGKHTTGQEFADILNEVHKMIIKWNAAYDPRN